MLGMYNEITVTSFHIFTIKNEKKKFPLNSIVGGIYEKLFSRFYFNLERTVVMATWRKNIGWMFSLAYLRMITGIYLGYH